ncbi:Uncharacterized protein Fot_10365 [Forsythia ovata]|uniref:Uncharacterized protein n=1 Tax=Forsythia ovata TaxID=205694 RepID=A0ABD1WGL5_9LAMI
MLGTRPSSSGLSLSWRRLRFQASQAWDSAILVRPRPLLEMPPLPSVSCLGLGHPRQASPSFRDDAVSKRLMLGTRPSSSGLSLSRRCLSFQASQAWDSTSLVKPLPLSNRLGLGHTRHKGHGQSATSLKIGSSVPEDISLGSHSHFMSMKHSLKNNEKVKILGNLNK